MDTSAELQSYKHYSNNSEFILFEVNEYECCPKIQI